MAKLTDNLKGVVKALGKERLTLEQLMARTGRTKNSVLSQISVKDYKPFFERTSKEMKDNEVVKPSFVFLTDKGLELLESILKEENENNTNQENKKER